MTVAPDLAQRRRAAHIGDDGGAMRRSGVRVAAIVALLAQMARPLWAEEAKAGLLWNRTGLPAVFPLQIKPPAGTGLDVLLTDAATGDEALAAKVPGDGPFRLLVPQGQYMARFSDAGGAAGVVTVGPLDFRVAGAGRKDGHLVTLSLAGVLTAEVRPFGLCAVSLPVRGVAPARTARPAPQRPPPPLPGEPRVHNGPPVLTLDGPPDLLRGPDAARWGPLAPPIALPGAGTGQAVRETPCD